MVKNIAGRLFRPKSLNRKKGSLQIASCILQVLCSHELTQEITENFLTTYDMVPKDYLRSLEPFALSNPRDFASGDHKH